MEKQKPKALKGTEARETLAQLKKNDPADGPLVWGFYFDKKKKKWISFDNRTGDCWTQESNNSEMGHRDAINFALNLGPESRIKKIKKENEL